MSDTIRCARCGVMVRMKAKAKKPKYCGTCRKNMQAAFRDNAIKARQDRARNIPVGPIEIE